MVYKVVTGFNDLKDHNYHYNVGDTYPRTGLEPTQERIDFLLGDGNLLGKPVIEKVAEKPKKRATRKKS